MIDRKSLKAAARGSIRAAKPHPFWVTAVTAVITAVLLGLSMHINGTFDTYREVFRLFMSGAETTEIYEVWLAAGTTSAFGAFLVFALEIMCMVVSVGYVLYCLRISRHEPASFGDVFDAFGIFFRAVIIRILRSLVISLWTMGAGLIVSVLLGVAAAIWSVGNPEQAMQVFLDSPWFLVAGAVMLVPAVVVSYFYRLADYLMLDHPDMSCVQCLSLSRAAMRGRKWELFRLDLSFLGWILLSIIPFVGFWVQPYITVTEAGFYGSVAPGFLQDLEKRMQEASKGLGTPNDRHGYHVPGSRNDDDSEEDL